MNKFKKWVAALCTSVLLAGVAVVGISTAASATSQEWTANPTPPAGQCVVASATQYKYSKVIPGTPPTTRTEWQVGKVFATDVYDKVEEKVGSHQEFRYKRYEWTGGHFYGSTPPYPSQGDWNQAGQTSYWTTSTVSPGNAPHGGKAIGVPYKVGQGGGGSWFVWAQVDSNTVDDYDWVKKLIHSVGDPHPSLYGPYTVHNDPFTVPFNVGSGAHVIGDTFNYGEHDDYGTLIKYKYVLVSGPTVIVVDPGTPDVTRYYLPGGGSSETNTDANWTFDTPDSPWVKIADKSRTVYQHGECPPAPVTAIPSASDPTCEADGALVIPEVPNVIFSGGANGDGPGNYNITAAAASGFTLTGEDKGPWPIEVLAKGTGLECPEVVTPVAPDIKKVATCGTYGSVTPAVTAGVTYSVEFNKETGAYTVTVVPSSDEYIFEGESQKVTFTGNVGAFEKCPTSGLALTGAEDTLPLAATGIALLLLGAAGLILKGRRKASRRA